MIRAVLDTNIIISALFWKGRPRGVFDAAIDKQYSTLTTEALTSGLKRMLAYPKFAQRIANQALNIEQLVDDYLAITVVVLPMEVPPGMVRDQGLAKALLHWNVVNVVPEVARPDHCQPFFRPPALVAGQAKHKDTEAIA